MIELNKTYYLVDFSGTLYSTSFFHKGDGDFYFKELRVEHTVVSGVMVHHNGFMTLDKVRPEDRLMHVTNPNIKGVLYKHKSNAAEKVIRLFNNKIAKMEEVKNTLTKHANIGKLISKI